MNHIQTEASGSIVNTSYPSQIFEKVAETLKKWKIS